MSEHAGEQGMGKANFQHYRKILSCLLAIILIFGGLSVNAADIQDEGVSVETDAIQEEDAAETTASGNSAEDIIQIASPSAILMEATTGRVIYQKAADEERSPASITKIMTLLLIFDALEEGRISLTDEVTTSAYAQSMGGSQVFLAEGEVQTVETLIKCIVVASGNDASVAMAEYICGSEELFVQRMNERAWGLGMQHTHFEDCCGLTNSDNHYTSAGDVAIMTRELITRYPAIFDYSTIWMEDITHVTRQGSSTFTLISTNRMLRQYEWTTGLKTGSTNKAKYCFSGTAYKDGISLIAVVMAAPDYRVRFEDAEKMLRYGYSVCALYEDENNDVLPETEVDGGVSDTVGVAYSRSFSYLDLSGADLNTVEKEIELLPAQAPVLVGQKAGEAVYYLNGTRIGSVDLVYTESVKKAAYRDYLSRLLQKYLL